MDSLFLVSRKWGSVPEWVYVMEVMYIINFAMDANSSACDLLPTYSCTDSFLQQSEYLSVSHCNPPSFNLTHSFNLHYTVCEFPSKHIHKLYWYNLDNLCLPSLRSYSWLCLPVKFRFSSWDGDRCYSHLSTTLFRVAVGHSQLHVASSEGSWFISYYANLLIRCVEG